MKKKDFESLKQPQVASIAGDAAISSGLAGSAVSRSGRRIAFRPGEVFDGSYRVKLYRFMADAIPLVNAVIWTWSRLAAAPGSFEFRCGGEPVDMPEASVVLESLFSRINQLNFAHGGGPEDVLQPFFRSLFLEGGVAGAIELYPDLSGIEAFSFFNLAETRLKMSPGGLITVAIDTAGGERRFGGENLFFHAHNADVANPFGRSILAAVPFVAYVEQQLVDDMRRSMHNAGYHRVHVKIKPPERQEGETTETYVRRANEYFDETVSMIRDIETEDNPVTWDDVSIEYIGPKHQGGVRSGNWYLSHRAMVEELCSGTNLAPFLLGYAYNATTNWAQFKYDLVMRQVQAVQRAAILFLGRLANIELALRGFSCTAAWIFDNTFSALAGEHSEIRSRDVSSLIDLYTAGLIDEETARSRAARLV